MIGNKNKKQVSLEEITKKLNKLRMPFGLVFTPTNLEEEKIKFLESDTYNPVFKYKIVRNSNEQVLAELSQVQEVVGVDPRISEFYLELIKEKSRSHKLMMAVGKNEAFTDIAIEKYGRISPILFRNACRAIRGIVNNYKFLDEEKVAAQEYLEYDDIKKAFEKVLEYLGLTDWKLEKSKKIAKNGVKMGIKRKRIYVDPGIKKRSLELRKTIVHEVGTHLLRSVNGDNTGYDVFSKANVPAYLDVEEGLAMYNEELMGVMTQKDLVKRAIFVWAISIGVNMSFRDLYNAVLAVLPRKEAFDVCYRVKRGMGDTSQPGIYPKDIVYFRGFRRIRKKILENSSLYGYLYVGKISMKQVAWVQEGLLTKPKVLPSKEVFERAFKLAGI